MTVEVGVTEATRQTPMLLDVFATEPQRFLDMPFESLHIHTFIGATVTISQAMGRQPLLVRDLGWTREEAASVRAQLATFEADWDAPGMDAYDEL